MPDLDVALTRQSRVTGTFTEAEYRDDPARVVAHAAATGSATVVRDDGSPRVVITIPTADLSSPTLMSDDCTCPHQDAREPDHDWECPACPRFDRVKAQELITLARNIVDPVHDYLLVLIDGLAEQLNAARRTIDRVPVDVLAVAMMPKVKET